MKFLIAVVALLAVVGSIESYSVAKKARSLTKRSTEIINKIKDKNIKGAVDELDLDDKFFEEFNEYCPDQEEQLKEASTSFVKCVEKIDDSITVCDAIEVGLTNCTKTLTQVLDNCLPSSSKGLPDLAVKSITSVLKHSCSVSGGTNLELLNPCFYDGLDDDSSEEDDDALESSLTSTGNKFAKEFPTKDDICGFLSSVREGIQDHLKANCKNPKTKAAFTGLYEAIILPCNELTNKSNETK